MVGNFYRLLREVEAVAGDLYFAAGGIGAPSVLVRGIAVSGD